MSYLISFINAELLHPGSICKQYIKLEQYKTSILPWTHGVFKFWKVGITKFMLFLQNKINNYLFYLKLIFIFQIWY